MSLGSREALSRVPGSVEWGGLFVEAQRQSVVGVLMDGLERLPAGQKPAKQLLLQWIGYVQLTEASYVLQCERAKELTSIFLKAGYNCCVLKGVGLAQLYPYPERRQCGDIDLWVNGDRKAILKWLKEQYTVEHVLWHHADVKMFEDVVTEIHYHAGWMYDPFRNHQLQKWFESEMDAQMVIDEKLGFAYPTVRFNAVYALAHLYHHLIEEGVGLRHVADYYYVLRALPADERVAVMNDLNKLGMRRLARGMMWVLADVCGMSADYLLCEPDAGEGRFLRDEIMSGGNFGRYRTDNRLRNSAARLWALLPHYPCEAIWILPWKLWHKCWRLLNS